MATPRDLPAIRVSAWHAPTKPWVTVLIGILMILMIGSVDLMIEPQLSSAFFYLLPVIYVGRHAGWWSSMGCALLASLVSLNADLMTSKSQVYSFLPFSNAALRFGVLLVVLRLVRSLRDLNDSLEARVRDRTARLQSEVRERLKLESRILDARESEQTRMGQDLHDGLCQHLVVTAFSASLLQRKLEEHAVEEAGDAAKIVGLIDESITQARDLAKGLYPVPLEEEGLEMALHALANSTAKRAGIPCSLHVAEKPSNLEIGTTIHLYRIAQEAVNNAIKHSAAKSVNIEFDSSEGDFDLQISDNGQGLRADARSGGGMGLHIMEYRARAIGAKLEITARKDGGTCVRCVSTDVSASDE